MKDTIKAEYSLFGNLDKVHFEVNIRSRPVKPGTRMMIPWVPEIDVVWNGNTRNADIRIRWVSFGLVGEEYKITQEIGSWFDFDMFWPRSIPICPKYMFDIECYYMGETEEFSERFFEPSGHHLEIVPRSSWRGQRIYMLNADATADWLELS
jgi:hypothetical protein